MNSNDDISEVLLPQNQQDGTLISTASSPVQRSRATSADEAPLSGHQDLKVDEAPLTLAFDQLNLHEKPQMAERMFLSLGVIIQHATEVLELEIEVQEVQDTLRRADQISRNGNRDVEALATIQAVLAQLFLLRDSNHLVEAATILANASRDGKSVVYYLTHSFKLKMAESWRSPFGQSGLLALFLRIQATTGVEDRVLIPSLKFIGNTCADTDINRELAISPVYIPSLIRHVENPGITRTIVPVIYNISNDNGTCCHCPCHCPFDLRGCLPIPRSAGHSIPRLPATSDALPVNRISSSGRSLIVVQKEHRMLSGRADSVQR